MQNIDSLFQQLRNQTNIEHCFKQFEAMIVEWLNETPFLFFGVNRMQAMLSLFGKRTYFDVTKYYYISDTGIRVSVHNNDDIFNISIKNVGSRMELYLTMFLHVQAVVIEYDKESKKAHVILHNSDEDDANKMVQLTESMFNRIADILLEHLMSAK